MAIKITKYDKVLRQLLLVKQNYTCQRCKTHYHEEGNLKGLHTSHFWGRGNWAVRLDLDNVDLMCFKCHQTLEANPHDYKAWKLRQLGPNRYNDLMRRAKSVKKWSPGEKEQLYQAMKAEVNTLRREQ